MRADSKARLHVIEVLVATMREKDLREITVSELINRSNVSRSTFYYHFENKEDVCRQMLDELLVVYRNALVVDEPVALSKSDTGYFQDRFRDVLDLFYERRDWLWAITHSSLKNEFCEKFVEAYIDSFSRVSHYINGEELSKRDHKYFDYITGNACLGGILCWAERGFRESPDEYVELVYRMLGMEGLSFDND